MRRQTAIAALAALASTGCAGDGNGILKQFGVVSAQSLDQGEAAVRGDFDGGDYEPSVAISQVIDFGNDEATVVILTEDPDMCGDWSDETIRFGSEFLVLFLYTAAGQGAEEPGVYDVDSSGELRMEGAFHRLSPTQCTWDIVELLDGGSVEVEEVSGHRVIGSLSVSGEDGSGLDGTFHSSWCSGIVNWFTDSLYCGE